MFGLNFLIFLWVVAVINRGCKTLRKRFEYSSLLILLCSLDR